MKKLISFVTFCLMIFAGALCTSCLNNDEDAPDIFDELKPGKAIIAAADMTNDSKFTEEEMKSLSNIINSIVSNVQKETFIDGDILLNFCKSHLKNGIEDLPEELQIKLKKNACIINMNGYYLSPDSKKLTFSVIFNCVDELPNIVVPEG